LPTHGPFGNFRASRNGEGRVLGEVPKANGNFAGRLKIDCYIGLIQNE
jgi:hypothetical protein